MSKNFHFLNHTSLVLEDDGYFLLLDPWPSDSLSFDSWKPHPPCFLNDDLLAAFINVSGDKAGLVISHGHDDHCDDYFLRKVSSSTAVFFPNYKSKGAMRRLSGNGLANITQVNELEFVRFGPFDIATYIIEEHSEDDAVFIIRADDYVFVHANDNSVEFPQELVDFIIDAGQSRKIYFASQTGIANGYPYCYPQFMNQKGKDDITDIVLKKTSNTIQVALDNANLVGADHFITYAAYTISMPLLEKHDGDMNQFFPSPGNLQSLGLNWGKVNLLDFVPGDTLSINDDKITRPFWMKHQRIEDIANELKGQRLKSIDTFSAHLSAEVHQLPPVSSEQLIGYVKQYLQGFFKHVSGLDSFWKDEIVNKTIDIEIEGVGSVMVDLKNGSFLEKQGQAKPNKRIVVNRDTCLLLMAGVFNFESLYIGHHAFFERHPREKYNHELMMQLQVYGYIYQKRLVPEELVAHKNS